MPEPPRLGRVVGVLMVSAAAFAFQETAMLPILPHIQRALGGSKSASALLESAFLLVASSAAPLLGKLGDRFGKRTWMLVAFTIYALGGAGAALSVDMPMLIACRALQGVGGAIFGLSFALLRDVGGRERLSALIGLMIGSFGTGMGAGYALAGVVTSDWSWRAIFWIGVGLVTLAALGVRWLVPRDGERHGTRTDFAGALLLGSVPTAVVAALALGPARGYDDWLVLVLFAAAVALGGVWVWYEGRSKEPLLDVATLARRVVLLPNAGSMLAGWAGFSLLFVVPRFVQVPADLPPHLAARLPYGFGASQRITGLYLVPFAIGVVLGGPSGGFIGKRWGGRGPFGAGLALLGVAATLCALVHGGPWLLLGWLLAAGCGFGASVGAAGTLVTQAVDPAETGVATTFNSVMRLAGGGIGAELAAGLLQSHVVAGTRVATEAAFAACFWIAAGVSFAGAALVLLVGRTGR